MSKKTNGIKEQIALLQEKLRELEDENRIAEIQAQIKELEKLLPNPIWKKIGKWLGIISVSLSIVYVVLDIILILV